MALVWKRWLTFRSVTEGTVGTGITTAVLSFFFISLLLYSFQLLAVVAIARSLRGDSQDQYFCVSLPWRNNRALRNFYLISS